MRKLIYGITAAIMLFGTAYTPADVHFFDAAISEDAAEAAEYTEDGFGCVNTGDGVRIVSYTGTDTDLVLPSVIRGKDVTSIAPYCFEFNNTLRHVTISDSIKDIGDHAFFGCRGLISADIPTGVTSIGNSCFWGCTKLEKVHIPDSVTVLGPLVFSGCTALTDVALPSGLEVLPDYTFNSCRSLSDVTIPESVTEIRYKCFTDCTSLKTLRIPKDAKIADHAVGFYTEDSSCKLTEGFTMYVYHGSPAEEYAVRSGVPHLYADAVAGDVNADGTVNVNDIALIAAHIKGIAPMDTGSAARADVNGDDHVTVTDLSMTAAHVKGKKSL